jgi:hypothetical protein
MSIYQDQFRMTPHEMNGPGAFLADTPRIIKAPRMPTGASQEPRKIKYSRPSLNMPKSITI